MFIKYRFISLFFNDVISLYVLIIINPLMDQDYLTLKILNQILIKLHF